MLAENDKVGLRDIDSPGNYLNPYMSTIHSISIGPNWHWQDFQPNKVTSDQPL